MIPTNGGTFSSAWTRSATASTVDVDCSTPGAAARAKGAQGTQGHRAQGQRSICGKTGQAAFFVFLALLASHIMPRAGAQTARVAGEVTSFGSSMRRRTPMS